MAIEEVLKKIDASDDEVIALMSGLISIPAISPESGGQGEAKRADYLLPFLRDFDEVKRIDAEDPEYPGMKRSSLIAIKKGQKPGTVWILSHIDTVPPGELSDWKYDPFKVTVVGDRLYGRGTEDDGEAVVASIIASREYLQKKFNGKSLGVLFVADEEIGSTYGLKQFIDSGIFKEGDTFFIPDSSDESQSNIHIMEKSIVWIKVDIFGEGAHGSCPRAGLNPIPVGMGLMNELVEKLTEKYSRTDDGFEDERTTVTPTRLEVSPGGTNAIPAHMYFAIDCRILPLEDPSEFLNDAKKIIEDYKSTTKARIECDFLFDSCGKASSTETDMYKVLAEAIGKIIGKPAKPAGPNGGTCASYLRKRGYDSYAWVMYTGREHMPNEYTTVDNVKKDAMVMAYLIEKLCL